MRLLPSMILTVGSLTVVASAQSRDSLTLLQRGDTYHSNQEVVAAVDTLAPGARANWHKHPGTMVAFVSEGAVTLEQESKQPVMYTAGQSFIIPSGVAHSSVNNGTSPVQMFVTFVAAKGTPLSSPVRSDRR